MGIKGLKLDADLHSENIDTLGGGGFTLNTGLYAMRVDLAYETVSSKGATGVVVHFKPVDGGNATLRETYWVTSRKSKGGNNFYIDGQGRKRLLPGMLMADQIAQITTGKHLGDLDTEKKTIKLFDYIAKKEVPKEVEVISEMIGKEIAIGVHKKRENRRAEVDGEWVNLAQDKTINEAHRVFFPDGYTTTEKKAGASEPVFVKKWTARYDENYVNDQYEPVDGDAPAGGDSSDAPAADGGTKQLFG